MMVNHYGYIMMVYFMENNMFQWMIRYIHLCPKMELPSSHPFVDRDVPRNKRSSELQLPPFQETLRWLCPEGIPRNRNSKGG
jgi:hypothetical protein